MGTEGRSARHHLRTLHPRHPLRRVAAALQRPEGRDVHRGPPPGASRVRQSPQRADSLLPAAPLRAARHHRLGADQLQVRRYPARHHHQVGIRPLLHQEHVSLPGQLHHLPHPEGHVVVARRAIAHTDLYGPVGRRIAKSWRIRRCPLTLEFWSGSNWSLCTASFFWTTTITPTTT